MRARLTLRPLPDGERLVSPGDVVELDGPIVLILPDPSDVAAGVALIEQEALARPATAALRGAKGESAGAPYSRLVCMRAVISWSTKMSTWFLSKGGSRRCM